MNAEQNHVTRHQSTSDDDLNGMPPKQPANGSENGPYDSSGHLGESFDVDQDYRELADMLPQAVFETDLKGRLTFLNRRGLDLFGYTREEIEEGLSAIDALSPPDRAKAAENIRRRLAGESSPANEYQARRKDGTTFPALISTARITRDGTPVGLRGVVTDVSEIKRYANALSGAEKRFQDLAEKSLVGVFHVDSEVLSYVNPRFAEVFGYQVADLVGKKRPGDLIHHDDVAVSWKKGLARMAAGAGSATLSVRGLKKNGDLLHLEILLSRDKQSEGSSYLGTVIDRTQRHNHETQMVLLTELAFGLSKAASLAETLKLCLDTALRVSGMENGGIYLTNIATGGLHLATSRGPLRKSMQKRLEGDEQRCAALSRANVGQPLYVEGLEASLLQAIYGTSLIRCGAVMPVFHQGNLIACITVASCVVPEMPRTSRKPLETIAAQMDSPLLRIQMEEALRKSVEKYWALVDEAADGILLADTEGKILEANRKTQEILCFSKDEMLGLSLRKLAPADQRDQKEILANALRKLAASGSAFAPDIMLVRKGGGSVPVSLTANHVHFGRRKFIQVIFRDITKQKQAEAALRYAKERAELLYKVTPSAIFTVDAGGITSWNDRAAEITGHSREEVTGRSCSFFLGPACREACAQPHGFSSVAVRARELVISRHDGSERVISLNCEVLNDLDEKAQGRIASFEDVTERKHAEAALRESEDKFRNLAEKSVVGIYVIQDNLFQYVNPRFVQIHGYAAEDLLNRKGPADLMEEDAWKTAEEKAKTHLTKRGGFLHIEFRCKRPDGRMIDVECYSSRTIFNGRPALIGTVVDVTDRLEAERALRQSEEKYRILRDHASDAIILVGEEGIILEVNKKAEELLGFSKGELVGMECAFFHPGMARGQGSIDPLPSVGSHRHGWRDLAVLSKDGRSVSVDLSWNVVHHAGRSMTQIILHDITERKRAEEALRESENRYKTVFQNTGSAMVMLEEDMTIALANSEFERITGYAGREIEGRNWTDFVEAEQGSGSPSVTESGRAVLRLVEKTTTDTESYRARIKTKDGSERHAHVTIASLPLSEKKIASLIDVSAQVLAERAMRQSEERYRALVEQSSEGIFTIDPRTRVIVEANESFLNMLGYESEEVHGLSLYDIIMEGKSFIDSVIGRTLQKGQYFVGTHSFRGKGARVLDVDVATSVVNYGNANYIMVSFRDVTEKKQMEAALQQAQKMEAIGTLAGGIAHDFNNILQVITGYSYHLTQKLGNDDKLGKIAGQILSAAEKGAKLTTSILAFSRKQAIDPKPVDINVVINNTKKFLKRVIGEDIELKFDSALDTILVMADHFQIEQVLMNLATNARDAMPEGGLLRIRTDIQELDQEFIRTHGFGEPGAFAQISVSDTGTGMDEETKRRVFEPFYTTKNLGKGTGLGMAMVYGIVKQHKGYVTIASELGAGTTINILLPLVAIGRVEEDAPGVEPQARGGEETILLAEDEPEVRELMVNTLREAGYSVIEAENGEDAVEKFLAHQADISLIVLDVLMPKRNGKQAYDDISALKRGVKAIFMSGYNEEIMDKKGILKTGVTLLSKPVMPLPFLKKVRETLDS